MGGYDDSEGLSSVLMLSLHFTTSTANEGNQQRSRPCDWLYEAPAVATMLLQQVHDI